MIDNGDLAMSFNAFKTKKAKYLEEEALYEAASFAPKEFDKMIFNIVDTEILKYMDEGAGIGRGTIPFLNAEGMSVHPRGGGYVLLDSYNNTPKTFNTKEDALKYVKKEYTIDYKAVKSEIGDDMFSMLAKNTLGTISDVKIDLIDAQIKEIYDKLPDDKKSELGVKKTAGTDSTPAKLDFSGVDAYLSTDGSTGLTSSTGKVPFKIFEMGETGKQIASIFRDIQAKRKYEEIANSIAINPTYKQNTPLPFYNTYDEGLLRLSEDDKNPIDLETEIVFDKKQENGTPLFKIKYMLKGGVGSEKPIRYSLQSFELGDAVGERNESIGNGSYINLFR